MTDAELIDASRRGERAAFGRLVERYQALVCAVSYGATGDRALSEDVAQETFLAAWRQLPQLEAPSKLRAWLCGIARNLGLRARRDAEPAVPDEAALDAAVDGPSPFDAVVEAQARWIVRDTLARVPDTYRDVLVLYYQSERSIQEVARSLGISEAAALQRLSRGRRYLADGVSDLVERSLADSRPRRSLPALVVAALPAEVPRVEALTQHGGWNMFKLGLALSALVAAAGGTAYVVHATGASPSEERAADPATSAAAAADPAPAAAAPRGRSAAPPALPAAPAARTPVVLPEPAAQPDLDQATLDRLDLERGPSRGPADAPVTIVVFTDFMCSFCGTVLGTIDELWDEYPDALRLVIKQFPVHGEAVLAAEAAYAAEAQGKFWELHDLMMASQDDLSREALLAHARTAGLDVAAFERALAERRHKAAVESDMEAGREIEVQGTPAFLINGKRFQGARPIEQFRAAIDEALAARAAR